MHLKLEALHLKKVFNRRTIFRNISFVVEEGQTLLITGRNGSGKSTLAKLIADVLSPTDGTLHLSVGGEPVAEHRVRWIGFVSPYLQLYEEFTALENLALGMSIRGEKPADSEARSLLETLGLSGRVDDEVRTYSSGMKQRVKYAFALIHRPPVLVLDEPMSNLDTEGIAAVRDNMKRQVAEGMLIVATNDLSDVEKFDRRIDLNA